MVALPGHEAYNFDMDLVFDGRWDDKRIMRELNPLTVLVHKLKDDKDYLKVAKGFDGNGVLLEHTAIWKDIH